MTATRKARVPMSEQIRLINECRRSGMTDADWCRKHDIAPSTFYNWIHRCRKAASDQIPAPSYGHHEDPQPRQDVVAVDIVPDRITEHAGAPAALHADTYIDNSHTIEIRLKALSIRIRNDADPVLLTRTFRLLQEFTC
jgi:transposase-like protein